MYAVEYTWIRNPTPVMMSRNKVESGSTRNAKGIFRWPALIKSKSVTVTGSNPSCFTCRKIPALTIKEARIVADPINPESGFEIDFLKRPFIRKPTNGNNGTKKTYLLIFVYGKSLISLKPKA